MYTPTQRLMRSRTEKLVAGVAGGIGQFFAVDPVIVRLAFIALSLTGVGLFIYPILWLVMPLEGHPSPRPGQAVDEMRQQAQQFSEAAREVFVAQGSTARRPRYDPMSGEPLEPEAEIPINNIGGTNTPPASDPTQRRNRLLGMVLLGVGAFILLKTIPAIAHIVGAIGGFIFPLLLIGIGIMMLRRQS